MNETSSNIEKKVINSAGEIISVTIIDINEVDTYDEWRDNKFANYI